MQIYQGIDLVDVRRFQSAMERQGKRFRDRIFTRREQSYCEPKRMKYEHYAARFAAKEAALKVIPKKGNYAMTDIEVRKHATGKPYLYVAPAVRKRMGIPKNAVFELSLTHEREAAMAAVLLVIP